MAISAKALDDIIQQVLSEYDNDNSIPFSIGNFNANSSEQAEDCGSQGPSNAPTMSSSDASSIQEAFNRHNEARRGSGKIGCCGHPKPTPIQVLNKYQKVKFIWDEDVTEVTPQFAKESKHKRKKNKANRMGIQSGNGDYCKKSSENSRDYVNDNPMPFSIGSSISQEQKNSSEQTEEGESECPSNAPTMQSTMSSSDEISIQEAYNGHRNNAVGRGNSKLGCSGHLKPTPKQVLNKYEKVKLIRKEDATEAIQQFAKKSKQKPKDNKANALGTQSGNSVYCKKSSSYITVMEYIMPAPPTPPQIFKPDGPNNKVVPEKGYWKITKIKKPTKQSRSEDATKIEKISKEQLKQEENTDTDAYPPSGLEMRPKKTKKKKLPEEKERKRQKRQSRQCYLNMSIYRRSITGVQTKSLLRFRPSEPDITKVGFQNP